MRLKHPGRGTISRFTVIDRSIWSESRRFNARIETARRSRLYQSALYWAAANGEHVVWWYLFLMLPECSALPCLGSALPMFCITFPGPQYCIFKRMLWDREGGLISVNTANSRFRERTDTGSWGTDGRTRTTLNMSEDSGTYQFF